MRPILPIGPDVTIAKEFSPKKCVTNSVFSPVTIQSLRYALRGRRPLEQYNPQKWIQRASHVGKGHDAAEFSTD